MNPILRFAVPAFARPVGLALLLAACAGAQAPKPRAVPENLKVPGDLPFLLRAAARGAQIYLCKPKANDASAFEWALKAPDADLFDQAGAKIGRHYAGPTWESTDGSKVVGEAVERAPGEGAIPWLLLRAKANEGAGAFSGVKYVQRLDTKGGLAPAGGCDATAAGLESRVEYTANYDFYGTR